MGNITSLTPAEIISLHQGQPVTTSLKVAELFGKRHDDVLKKIRNLECSSNFRLRNFAETFKPSPCLKVHRNKRWYGR